MIAILSANFFFFLFSFSFVGEKQFKTCLVKDTHQEEDKNQEACMRKECHATKKTERK
jgi:hypothetical protein